MHQVRLISIGGLSGLIFLYVIVAINAIILAKKNCVVLQLVTIRELVENIQLNLPRTMVSMRYSLILKGLQN